MPTNLTCANAVSHFDFNIWLFFPISANLFRSQSDLYWTKPILQLWCQDAWMASRWRYHHWQRPFAYHGICLWTTRIWFGRSQSFNWKSQMFWINHGSIIPSVLPPPEILKDDCGNAELETDNRLKIYLEYRNGMNCYVTLKLPETKNLKLTIHNFRVSLINFFQWIIW